MTHHPDTAPTPGSDAPPARVGYVEAVRSTLLQRGWGDRAGSAVADNDDLVDIVAEWLVGAVIECRPAEPGERST